MKYTLILRYQVKKLTRIFTLEYLLALVLGAFLFRQNHEIIMKIWPSVYDCLIDDEKWAETMSKD